MPDTTKNAPASAGAPHKSLRSGKNVLILLGAALVYMATNADAPSFNLTIPTLQDQFDASFFATQLLTNAAQLCVAALVLTAGTLGDLYGRRRWLLIGAIGMFLGFMLQTISVGIPMLIGARLLVGCSTALTTALTLAVVNVSFTGASQSRAIGIFLGLGSLSAAITPIASQFLNQTFGWRLSFIIPLALCGLGIFMVFRYVPESRNEQSRKLDIGGIVFNAVGLAGIVYGCILAGSQGLTARSTLTWLMIGAVGLALFVWWERRTPDPALKLSLFKNPVFALAVFAALTLNLVDYGIQPTFSTFLQSVQGRTPFLTSILLLPWALGAAVMAPVAGHWATRVSPRKLIVFGLAAGAASLLLSLLLTPDSSPWLVLLIVTPWALAYGVANIPRTSVLMNAASQADSGAASGANSMGTETGSALGLAVFGTLTAMFTTRNFAGQLTDAGLPADKVTTAVDTLRSAIQGSLQQPYPTVPADVLGELKAAFATAYTDSITAILIISALLIFATAAIVWIGMRGHADQPLTDDSA